MSRQQIFRIDEPKEKAIKERIVRQNKLDEIGEELEQSLTDGFFNYVDEITSTELFKYIVIVQIFILIFGRIPIKLNHTIGLIFGIIVAYFLNEKSNSQSMTEMKELEIKMERIEPRPSYFYVDANMIELFFNMLDFKKYNDSAYEKAVKNTDVFLKLMVDIEIGSVNCKQDIDVAKDMSKHALNHLHSIIHRLPSNEGLELKLKNSIRTLQIYFKRHLEHMIDICNKKVEKDGYNIYNQKIYKDHPSPNEDYNPNYNVF